MLEHAADEALLRFLAKHGRVDAWITSALEDYIREHKVSAVEALCDGGFIEENAIVELFQDQLRLPRIDLSRPPILPRSIDPELLYQHLALPAAVDAGRLLLAMANPLDYEIIKKVRFASGLRVVPAVAPLSEIRAALPKPSAAAPAVAAAPVEINSSEPESLMGLINNSPIVKMAALLIEQGIAQRASDIHLEPTLEGLTLRYRIDGMLEEATRVSVAVRNPLIARLKVMAKLDIAERRVPQDGGVT
ncbi:MAG TPA: ATPase, T2SS/T4P/T4SS family, partial [Rhizomicrobium sp.]